MPAKPKPAAVKPAAPKQPTSLYKAIRERLEAKDRETLHARTTKAVEAVENLLELGGTGGKVSEATASAPAPVAAGTPWSLEGLVVDPDPRKSKGRFGFFWDEGANWPDLFQQCDGEGEFRQYTSTSGSDWDHFAYIPNFPVAELLKRTTGYEVT